MASVNKAILVGNLGADPELRWTPNGNPVAQFTMATTEKRNDNEYTEWHRINVWGTQGENVAKYLGKGSKAYVEGRIQTRSYEKEGVKRYVTEVVAQKVVFLDNKPKSEHQGGFDPAPAPADQDYPSADNIPF